MAPLAFDLNAFLTKLDQHPNLRGGRVVYFDGFRMHVLREGPPYCGAALEAIVLREAVEDTVLHDADAAKGRDGKLLQELLSLGLSCSAATIGWVAVAGSAAAAPVTGGTSLFITYLSTAAAYASSAQCLNAIVRTGMEIGAPETLDVVDSNVWYQRTSVALDAISLAGAATAAAATVRLVLTLRRVTGKSMIEVLKGLSRQERRKLAEEAVRIDNPGLSAGEIRALVRAGAYPKRFSELGVSQSVRKHLLESLSASLDFTGSATGGVVRKAAGMVVGVARSLDTVR